MKLIIKIILCLVLSSGMLGAQPLENLLEIATENNLELKALYQEYLSALEKGPQVSELPDPEVGAGVFVLPAETRLGPQWVRVGASQMFPWKGTLKTREDVVLTMAKAQFEKVEIARLNLFFIVRKAYFQLYELEKSQDVIRRNIEIFRAMEQLTLTGVASGKVTLADVLRVQLTIQELEQKLVILENQKEKPLARINQVLNRPLDNPVTISDTLTLAIIPFDKTTLLAHIQSNHPAVRMFAFQQEAAQKSIRLNELNGKPSFGVGLDYIMVGKRGDADPSGNGRDILLPKASIKIPLYRKKYGAKQREEELRILALEDRKQDIQLKFLSFIEQAYADYQDAILKLELYDDLIVTTNATIEILESDYSTSGKNFDELLRLQNQLVNYDLKILMAIVKSHIARAEIEKYIN